jgi:hypothetical protein
MRAYPALIVVCIITVCAILAAFTLNSDEEMIPASRVKEGQQGMNCAKVPYPQEVLKGFARLFQMD